MTKVNKKLGINPSFKIKLKNNLTTKYQMAVLLELPQQVFHQMLDDI